MAKQIKSFAAPPIHERLAEHHDSEEHKTFPGEQCGPPPDLLVTKWVARTFSVRSARARCQECIREYLRELQKRENERQAWQKERNKHFRRIQKSLQLRTKENKPQGHRWDGTWIIEKQKATPTWVEGWVPVHLIGNQEPVAIGPFPFHLPNLSLAGCFTALAIVFDCEVGGGEPLCPWTEKEDRVAFQWYESQRTRLRTLTGGDLLGLEACGVRVAEDLGVDSVVATGVSDGNPTNASEAPKLNATDQKILAACRERAVTGMEVKVKVHKSYDYVRQRLGKLMKAGLLERNAGGYRTVEL